MLTKNITANLIRSLLFGAIVVDRFKHVVLVNDAALKMMGGKSEEDIIGKRCHKNICPAEEGKCPVIDLGHNIDLSEKVLLDRSGNEVPILKTVSPIIMDGEEVLLETFIDITDLKNFEKKLKESETKYRIVADKTNDWEFWLSPRGKFLYSSPSCKRITGYSVEHFIDDPGLLSRLIHPDDLQLFLQHRHKVADCNTTDVDGMEFRIVRPDGDVRWIEHLCQPVYGPDGKYLGQRGSNHDITKRKRAEGEVIKAKEEWERTFDSIVDPIMILDKEQRIVKANKALVEAFGTNAPGLKGLSCYTVFHGTDEPPYFCPDLELLADGEAHSVEAYLEKLGGYYHISVSPIYDELGSLYGSIHHARCITDIKMAEAVLMEEKNKAQQYLDIAGAMIVVLDPYGTVTLINRKGCEILGYNEDEVVGKDWFYNFIPQGTREETEGVFKNLMAGNIVPVEKYENAILTKDGGERVIAFNNTVTRNQQGGIAGVLFSGEDITERRKYEAQLIELANHDPLTGLPNRKLLIDLFQQEMSHAMRNNKLIGVLYLDIDHFKTVNDSLGHDVGDLLLKYFSQRLKTCVRTSDTVSRLGGDEFIILLTDIGLFNDIVLVAKKILEEISSPFNLAGQEVSITSSIGIAIYPSGDDDVESLLKKADKAMYMAKKDGKNSYKFFTDNFQG